MQDKAMELIAGKLDTALKGMGYTTSWAQEEKDGESSRYALFTGKDNAYGVFFDAENKRFILRICAVENGVADEKWTDASIWMFDPETDTERDSESIANDFVESVSGSSRAVAKIKKRVKKDDENNVDPVFFINRMVTLFPDLKEELNEHKFYHPDVLPVYFMREKVAPKIVAAWGDRYNGGVDSKLSDKVFSSINDNYKNGDLDTRGIITQVILNSIRDEELEKAVAEKLDESLRKIWLAGRKYRDKPAKPEKPKTKGGLMGKFTGDTLATKR